MLRGDLNWSKLNKNELVEEDKLVCVYIYDTSSGSKIPWANAS